MWPGLPILGSHRTLEVLNETSKFKKKKFRFKKKLRGRPNIICLQDGFGLGPPLLCRGVSPYSPHLHLGSGLW